MWRLLIGLLALGGSTLGGVLVLGEEAHTPTIRVAQTPAATPGSTGSTGSTVGTDPRRPLRGRVVVLDAGHQLGNRDFPGRVNTAVGAGGFEKQCNTTGTATADGYPEASFTFDVTRRAAAELRRLGARVMLTRAHNSEDLWGPCVDVRGRAGNDVDADLKVSIHADGSWQGRGFHVIRPALLPGYTDDVYDASGDLARDLRDALKASGHRVSGYVGHDGFDERGDLATLNLSDVPVAMVEAGNMRDPTEAALMESPAGRQGYADAVVTGVVAFLGR
jgi:N-acetylmuramoyl-L-alanine amidase